MLKPFFAAMCLLLLCAGTAHAQQSIYLTIGDSTIISSVTLEGKPVFTISGMNNIVSQYTVTGFQKAFPASRFRDIRKIYNMKVSSTGMATQLMASYPAYFSHYNVIPEPRLLSFTPNDYLPISGQRETGYLEYIKARDAWDITQGDPNIIIGLTDTYLETNHPDLLYQVAQLGVNAPHPTSDSQYFLKMKHGTMVSGLIAARTHNNNGYPAIGFSCRLDYSSLMSHSELFTISKRLNRRVLNASWGFSLNEDTLAWNIVYPFQKQYQEIYENGVFMCAAAGNTNDGFNASIIEPWKHFYPASLDYVFSSSSLGWEHTYGTNNYNVKGVHQFDLSDTNGSFRHNSRIDILSPGVAVGGLTNDMATTDPWFHWYTEREGWGTSLSSPITAGTAGLMVSANSCLSPYQLEYILKRSADSSVLSKTENLKYTGRLGAGGLDAGATLSNVQSGTGLNSHTTYGCNNPATTTFFIEGIDINTLCAPGFNYVNNAKPTLTPILRNGTPPYTYRWEYEPTNHTTLSALNVANPEITSSYGDRVAYYRLTVYDNSPVQKVASRYFKIQLTTANTFDLAGRDSYMDMLDEPNSMTLFDSRETQYYESPDLWNRQKKDGGTTHENAEYYLNDSNYVYVKVRNVGCASFTGGTSYLLKLYWTVASTGENWKSDWIGFTQLGGSAGVPIVSGGEIGTGKIIPALQPGQSATLVRGWRPRHPKDWDSTIDNINICLLARIVNPNDPTKEGMATPEVSGPVITNVQNNNNIFTRNLWVEDLNSLNRTSKTRFLISNANNNAQIFDVQFINDKAINLHFAGNFSAIGYVKLYLGALYDKWIAAGGQGSYLERNAAQKTVTMDGSQTLELLNIPLAANAKYPVDIEFVLHPGATIPDYRYDFHLRQFKVTDGQRSGDVYGSMSFRINTHSPAQTRQVNNYQDDKAVTSSTGFGIYPNPVKTNLTVSYLSDEEQTVNIEIYDVMGRKILGKKDQYFKNSRTDIDVADFVPGIYFITLTNGTGVNERFKFVKE